MQPLRPLRRNTWAPFDDTQHAGDMIPFHVSATPGTTTANTWNGLGGPQN